MRTRRVGLFLAVTALLVAACGGASRVADVEATPSSPTFDPTTPPSAGSTSTGDGGSATPMPSADATTPEPDPAALAALDFQARTVGGGNVDGTDFAGTKTVLWIWAPWCPQCNREAPNVKAAVERFADDLTIIGVAGKDTDAEHEEFVERHDLAAITHAIDDDGSLWAKYGVGYQPAWVFIAEDGTTRVVAGGLYDDLEPTLEDFLNS